MTGPPFAREPTRLERAGSFRHRSREGKPLAWLDAKERAKLRANFA
jgi:hypothetical protein